MQRALAEDSPSIRAQDRALDLVDIGSLGLFGESGAKDAVRSVVPSATVAARGVVDLFSKVSSMVGRQLEADEIERLRGPEVENVQRSTIETLLNRGIISPRAADDLMLRLRIREAVQPVAPSTPQRTRSVPELDREPSMKDTQL